MAQEMSIEAILSAVDQNFTKTMEAAVNSLEKVVGQSNNSASRFAANGAIFGATASLAASAMNMVKSGIGDIVTGLNQSSATWKTFEGNMSYLGKSSGQISKVRSELTTYAQQTIYSASDMATTYSQLAAVGIKNTTKLVKGFGGLASAAENPQQAMKTLSQQATQMAAKPTVQWQDFKLMLEQTPAGISAVAKAMGMSTSEMVSAVNDGKIKTQDFFNAIAKVGTNKSFSKMATEYKTVGQAMDGLKETITNKLQPAFDQLSGVGIKAVSDLVNWIDNINFDSVGDKIGQAFSGVAPILQGVWNTIVSTVQAYIPVIGAAFNAVKGVISGLAPIAGVVFGAIVAGVTIAMNALKALAPIIQSVLNNQIFQAAAIGVITFIGAFKAISGVVTVATTIMQVVKAFNLLSLAIKAAEIATVIFDAVMAINPFVLIIAAIVAVVAALTWFFTQTQAGQQLWQSFVTWFQTTLQALAQIATTVWTAIGNAISAACQWIVSTAQGLWQGFAGFWSGLWDSITSIASNVWSAIASAVSAGINAVKGIISSVMNGIKSVVSSAWEGIKNFFSSGVSFIKSVVHVDLSNAGREIMNSLLRGLREAWESVKSFVSGITKWFPKHKGPISVDRRLLIPAGHAIMNGLDNGLVDGFSDVQKSVLTMNKQITDAMQPDVSGFANRLNGMASDVQSRFAGSLTMQDSTLQMQNNALLRQIAGKDTTMILDSGALVGATAGSYDQRLGQRTALKDRWS